MNSCPLFATENSVLCWRDLPWQLVLAWLLLIPLVITGLMLAAKVFISLPAAAGPRAGHSDRDVPKVLSLRQFLAAALAVVLGGTAQQLFIARPWAALGLFALAGLLACWAAAGQYPPGLKLSRATELGMMAVLVLGSLTLRAAFNGEVFPRGLEQDEYIWAFDYERLFEGLNPFAMGAFGIPILQGSLNALAYIFLGMTPLAIHLVSILAGALTIIPTYIIARMLWGTAAALTAAMLLAFYPYHIFYSRIVSGGRIVFNLSMTLCLALGAARFLSNGQRRIGFVCFFVSGLFAALLLYDYFPVRAAPLFFILAAAAYLYRAFRSNYFRSALAGLGAAAAGFCLLLFPLARTAIQDHQLLSARMSQEGIIEQLLSGDVEIIREQIRRVAGMFVTEISEGRNYWFSWTKVMVLDPWLAALYGITIFLLLFDSLRRAPRLRAGRLLLLALLIALLPTLLSTGAPCSHRSLLTILPVTYITALGLTQLLWAPFSIRMLPLSAAWRHGLHTAALLTLLGVVATRQNSAALWEAPQRSGQFHADWHERMRLIGRLLPPASTRAVGARLKVHDVDLLSDYDPFLGIRLTYSGLAFHPWHPGLAYPPVVPRDRIMLMSERFAELPAALQAVTGRTVEPISAGNREMTLGWRLPYSNAAEATCAALPTACWTGASSFTGELYFPQAPESGGDILLQAAEVGQDLPPGLHITLDGEPGMRISPGSLHTLRITCAGCFARQSDRESAALLLSDQRGGTGRVVLSNLYLPGRQPILRSRIEFAESSVTIENEAPLLSAWGGQFVTHDAIWHYYTVHRQLRPKKLTVRFVRNKDNLPAASWIVQIGAGGPAPVFFGARRLPRRDAEGMVFLDVTRGAAQGLTVDLAEKPPAALFVYPFK